MERAVKKSLLAPVKTLKHCVGGETDPPTWSRTTSKRPGSKVRTCTTRSSHTHLHLLRSYQDDLERERRTREARNAQKNTERAAMREHFRRKYQLAEDVQDSERLRAVGRDVSLPGDLARMVRPKDSSQDDGFGLLRAFQNLRLSGANHSAASAEPCRVM